jgi:quercetin dioxygenase-like cupin family protein
MNTNNSGNPWIDIVPGIRRMTIVHGETLYQMIAELQAGSVLPQHQHEQEQITFIVKGRLRMIAAGVPHELAAWRFVLHREQCFARGRDDRRHHRARHV